jgi:hypothetical protein
MPATRAATTRLTVFGKAAPVAQRITTAFQGSFVVFVASIGIIRRIIFRGVIDLRLITVTKANHCHSRKTRDLQATGDALRTD